jgi:hypothetical protein
MLPKDGNGLASQLLGLAIVPAVYESCWGYLRYLCKYIYILYNIIYINKYICIYLWVSQCSTSRAFLSQMLLCFILCFNFAGNQFQDWHHLLRISGSEVHLPLMCGKSMKIHEKSQVSTQEMHGKTGTMTLGILGSSCHHPSHGCDGLGNTSWCALKDGLGVVAALTIPSYRLVQNGLYHNMDQHGHFRGKHS